MRNILTRISITGLSLLFLLAASQLEAATGDAFTLNGHDLQIEVDSRWTGCGAGGYCPVRVRVLNRGPKRTLTFRVTKMYDPLPNVRQSLELPQNGTASITLPVPMVNWTTYGEFRVEDRGGLLEGMNRTLTFPEVNHAELGRVSCVVVSSSGIDMQAFENGAATYRQNSGMAATGHAHYGRSSNGNTVVIPDSSLPSGWVNYSGVDLVVIPAASLAKVNKEIRNSLIQWVRCGGTLVVTNLQGASIDRDGVAKSLLGEAIRTNWVEATTSHRDEIRTLVEVDTSGAVRSTGVSSTTTHPNDWSRGSPPFALTDVGLGKLVVFATDPLPGTNHDWAWLLRSLGGAAQWEFGRRIGENARLGTDDFLRFLIPGISGVPVVMFIILITLFSIVIGPVNYFLLARRKQLHLLLLTIPAFAIVTSLLLFGYSAVAHGFSVKSRARSLTYIDQKSQTAVTMSRLSLYAGQAPSGGLRFSRDTLVMPIWPEHSGFESGNVDWSDSQVLTSGWLRSRTRTQFLTIGHRAERGRLEVKPQASNQVSVANGFEWGFEKLVITDESGKLFIGDNVSAGARVELKPATDEERKSLMEALQRYPLDLPAGVMSGGGPGSFWMSGPRHYRHSPYYRYGMAGTQWHAHQGRMETIWQRMTLHHCVSLDAENTLNNVVPRSFYGITDQNPGVELGINGSQEFATSHVVMGHW